MKAYYNEIDPFAADVLENLIHIGQIPDGVVDRRSIEIVQPSDLKGFTQCHFFAGFGVWPYALRRAGWADDRPVWTGSCPCPPFSTAGKKKACPECGGQRPVPHVGRTGVFVCCLCGHEWLADGRHLWPEFWRLIRDERPTVVFGEQVAGADGLIWIDIVRASLEIMAYAFGAADLCAAGVGAPHIRQRSFWVAHDDDDRRASGDRLRPIQAERNLEHGGSTLRLGDDDDARPQGHAGYDGGAAGQREGATRPVAATGVSGGLVDTDRSGTGAQSRGDRQARAEAAGNVRANDRTALSLRAGTVERLADDQGGGRREERADAGGLTVGDSEEGRTAGFVDGRRNYRPGPTNGFWEDADWLGCRDEKWRPVEPGTFPLAHGVANRVGLLRGYGNAIVAPLAQEFIETVMEYLDRWP